MLIRVPKFQIAPPTIFSNPDGIKINDLKFVVSGLFAVRVYYEPKKKAAQAKAMPCNGMFGSLEPSNLATFPSC